jgi:hypothetical protein
MFSAPRFVVVDDKKEHLDAVLQAFQNLGSPCIGLQFDPAATLQRDHFRGVRCLFLDLHLSGGQLGTDHKGDFARIQTILEDNISERGGPFVLIMWTAHPHLRDELVAYLEKNLDPERPHARPLLVLTLAKENFIDGATGSVKDPKGLQTAVTNAVSANPQLAALLGWEVDVLSAAAETLASLVGLIPVEQRTSADFSSALDAVLSRLARESVGLPNVDADHRAAITGALAPILVDRIMNQDVPQATKDLWKIAVTRHGDPQLGDASAKEAGQVNRMLHLALPAFETVRATDWGAVVDWPLPWSDEELAGRMGLTIGQMLGGQFLVEKDDRVRCRARLVRIGAACDYAQSRPGPITYLLGLEIPEDAARKKDGKGQQIRLSDAIWVSPVFLSPESPDPFRLHVHARFSLSVLPDSCAGWNSSYRLREQLLMHLIAFESDYGSRPGIVQLPVR